MATDRDWLAVIPPERYGEPLTAGARSPRDVRVEVTAWGRFHGLDRPYAIDALLTDHVRAANEAQEARRTGQPWSLDECGDSCGPTLGRHAESCVLRC